MSEVYLLHGIHGNVILNETELFVCAPGQKSIPCEADGIDEHDAMPVRHHRESQQLDERPNGPVHAQDGEVVATKRFYPLCSRIAP